MEDLILPPHILPAAIEPPSSPNDPPSPAAIEPPPPPESPDFPLFMMYCFKILPCEHVHIFEQCPFTHLSNTYRRAISVHLNPQYCPQMLNNNGVCQLGDNCLFLHDPFEMLYHPMIYNTIMCEMHDDCKGIYCPFFHNEEEHRPPHAFLRLFDPPTIGVSPPRMLLIPNTGGEVLPTGSINPPVD
ncbi:hypothetical protein LIER_36458 [Lithospermum erythrorhizon]|uniref:C3H1-type domain-containing protein n=1 Tax=Lithospermum erythrorhizon TaxID=34254 RepID=A0AAV3P8W7_LITER